MRSTLARFAAIALSATLLAACGSESESSDSGAAEAGGNSEAGAFPVTVTDNFGEVTIPEEPTRVVAMGWGDAETALALGVQPVGASDWLAFEGEGVGPWAEGMYDSPPELIATLEPDYEAVLALEPDLILDVKSSGDQERYDRLSEIAPTVGVPEGAENYLTTTDQQVELIAAALGVPEKGEEVLADIDEQFAEAAEAHPEFADKSVVAAAYTSEGWGAYVDGSERVEFLKRLGFTLSDKISSVETDEFSIDVSSENLDQLDADVLVTFPIYVDASEVSEQANYQALPVVQDGRAVLLDDTDISSAYSLGSPLSMSYAIEQMVPLLAEAVGDAQ